MHQKRKKNYVFPQIKLFSSGTAQDNSKENTDCRIKIYGTISLWNNKSLKEGKNEQELRSCSQLRMEETSSPHCLHSQQRVQRRTRRTRRGKQGQRPSQIRRQHLQRVRRRRDERVLLRGRSMEWTRSWFIPCFQL